LGRVLGAARVVAGATVLVEGPPGIGKSRLLAAAASSSSAFELLTARASELEREFPFGVVRQLLEPPLARAGALERAELLAGAARLAEPVLAVDVSDAQGEPSLGALHGLYWLVSNMAARRPVLAVVDDLHWADVPSLRWLAYLARRLDGVALALVLAARPREPGAPGDLLDALAAEPEVAVVRPRRLSAQAVARRRSPPSPLPCTLRPAATRSSSRRRCANSPRLGSCRRPPTVAR
jgi:AAA ATPase domain